MKSDKLLFKRPFGQTFEYIFPNVINMIKGHNSAEKGVDPKHCRGKHTYFSRASSFEKSKAKIQLPSYIYINLSIIKHLANNWTCTYNTRNGLFCSLLHTYVIQAYHFHNSVIILLMIPEP